MKEAEGFHAEEPKAFGIIRRKKKPQRRITLRLFKTEGRFFCLSQDELYGASVSWVG